MVALTPAEERLRSEVEEIASLVEMDLWNIEQFPPGPLRADYLKSMKDRLVRSEVVIRYALLDEFLTDIICDYYFHRPNKKVGYRKLWKTKHFKIFVHFLMDETFLLKKLAMVEAIMDVPTQVSKAIKRINDVRNALTHSFFLENRRRYMADKEVMYNGVYLSCREGVEKFQHDYEIAREYLAKKYSADLNIPLSRDETPSKPTVRRFRSGDKCTEALAPGAA
jgi:hypothetical protein